MATIAGIATRDARFDILVSALGFVDTALPGSNLVQTLSNANGDFTVFAPTDAAFGQLAKDLGFAGSVTDEAAVTTFLTTALTPETISDVLLYHVSAGEKTIAQIRAAEAVPTLNGATIAPEGRTLGDKEPDLLDASVVQVNIRADNGIIHAIDRVMLPVDLPGNDAPTIAGIVAASGAFDGNGRDFDILLQAATAAGLVPALADAGADLTVFAPTDAAFLKLATTLGFDGGTEAEGFDYLVDALTLLSGGGNPIPLLRDILSYHVLPDSLQSSQILDRARFETLLGEDLGRNGTRLVDRDPDVANPKLIQTDIQAANGIVHVIDGVLLPVNLPLGRNDDLVVGEDGADRISTGRGDDRVDGNGGRDFILAGKGHDLALGGDDADVIVGGTGNDRLFGNEGDDFLDGGTGRDRIVGGIGDDLLLGGLGRDTFVFDHETGDDVILDFRNGQDRIRIDVAGVDAFADLDISTVDGTVQIALFRGDTLSIEGIRASALDASDFIFG